MASETTTSMELSTEQEILSELRQHTKQLSNLSMKLFGTEDASGETEHGRIPRLEGDLEEERLKRRRLGRRVFRLERENSRLRAWLSAAMFICGAMWLVVEPLLRKYLHW